MNIKRKSEYIGALGALLVHVAIIALLILVSFAIPHPDEEAGGVPVMMGDVDAAYGNYDPSTRFGEMTHSFYHGGRGGFAGRSAGSAARTGSGD